MYFCARWLVWVFAAVIALMVMTLMITRLGFVVFTISEIASRVLIGITLSYLFAYFFPHKRPFVEFPEIQTLMRTKTSWKSFPSDHAYVSFCMAFSLYFLGFAWYYVLLGIIVASFVAIGRVYVGVHYPRDILGGAIWAAIVMFWSLFV